MNTLSDDGGWIGNDPLADAPEDHAATLLQAEPRSHNTVFMVCVQRRFRS